MNTVSVDGVMQGPGGPEEDERGIFERGGWADFDNEAGTVMDAIYQRADAFVFGRRTYEHFAGTWGTWDDPGDSPIWTALNTLPKHVVSTSRTDPHWAGTTVISGDVATAIRELKAKAGGELQVHGSGALFRWLLDNDLVDEMTLFTFPVIVGQGTRLFPDTGPYRALDLIETRATPSGVTIQVYRPAGRPQNGAATPDTNTRHKPGRPVAATDGPCTERPARRGCDRRNPRLGRTSPARYPQGRTRCSQPY